MADSTVYLYTSLYIYIFCIWHYHRSLLNQISSWILHNLGRFVFSFFFFFFVSKSRRFPVPIPGFPTLFLLLVLFQTAPNMNFLGTRMHRIQDGSDRLFCKRGAFVSRRRGDASLFSSWLPDAWWESIPRRWMEGRHLREKGIKTTREKERKRQTTKPADLLVKTLSRPNGHERGKFNEVPMKKARRRAQRHLAGPTSAGWFPSRYKRVRDQTSVASSKGDRNEWRGRKGRG